MEGQSEKKKILKKLIRRLHEGAKPEEIKEKFRDIVKDVTSTEIAQIEEELIREGMPREEIQRLCDIHLAVLRETLEKEKTIAPVGHPIHILMEEHKILLKNANELKDMGEKIKERRDLASAVGEMEHIRHIEEHLKDSESHYLREENVIFPYLERHGITQPPAIMWTEHDKVRKMEKDFYRLIDTHENMAFKDFTKELGDITTSLVDMLSTHFYKENNILFPTALKVITENEWKDIRKQFDELGYCCFTPEQAKEVAEELEVHAPEAVGEGKILFEIGELSKEELETALNTLPVDITFVDKEDTVRYFSQSKERIFPRTKAVIGRKVQLCHPQKSVHIVNKIVDGFKSGKKDVAEFWIQQDNRLIHIRYFAVRDKDGKYLGTIEVTQDITDIKKIEGEKRLLDWKD
ncbi:MAG: DUF438 domain-containing protein [Nitrososphaeria archaeon]|nr:DUF438 domain-containing protein [Nitrososphaeria archaeon]NIN52953.1 DUF438 domain-containing protein [Nitrososphaeria archaeon]NIQ33512.1 DUF438 domain-containing protein [Nitrososphaeria archaeon]